MQKRRVVSGEYQRQAQKEAFFPEPYILGNCKIPPVGEDIITGLFVIRKISKENQLKYGIHPNQNTGCTDHKIKSV
jgi:hypothetical protein